MNLTFRQLRVFVTLYELRSFTAAANALHMTQSAVSKLCSELEAEIGFTLFDRTTRKVVPADDAAHLYTFAIEMLGTLQAASRSLSDLTANKKGVVSIAAAQMVFYGLLRDIMVDYQLAYPGVRMEAYEVSTERAIENVINGAVDFSIVSLAQPDDRLTIETLCHDRLCVIFQPDHPLASQPTISWEDLARFHQIMLRSDNNMGKVVHEGMEKRGLTVRSTMEVGSLSTAIGFVESGLGIAVIAEYAGALSRRVGLEMKPLVGGEDTTRTLSLIRRRNARSSVAAKRFIEMLKSSLKPS
ncbi:LysR family transcriptional regulator [Pseudomonas graminis]|uniref:LysR family transcriptional regulator n=1 Tax=Pseudomonas graminis TaxID=158627 RepID=UPI003C151032